MNSTKFTRFLRGEVSDKGMNWHVQELAGVVFVQGPNRNLHDSNNLVTVSFFSNPPLIEFTEAGEEHKATILAMWQKYLSSHEDKAAGGAGKGVLDETYSSVTIIFIAGFALLCLAATALGIYISYRLFGG